MNPFTTDHPMMSEPSALAGCVRRRLLAVAAGYFVYIMLLGPFFALEGNGYLGSVPEPVGLAVLLPTKPVFLIPGLRWVVRDYLD